ncbi:MAG: glycosyltransferase family 2 protein [Planctomycetota bacterium]
MAPPRALLAIPVFNEDRYVSRVLRRVRAYISDILVINDGSTDRTAEVLAGEHDLYVIEHPENRGYGKSLAETFAFGLRHEYEWLITMDCDEQHEPAAIPDFLAAARRDEADVISGSRYLKRFGQNSTPPADRRAINCLITGLLNERLGLGITDAFCGFKAYRVAALSSFNITVPGYAMPLQLWVQAARAGLRIVELPVRLIYRDPNRHFGGLLDDPQARLKHYLEMLNLELSAQQTGEHAASPSPVPTYIGCSR